jgi:periplasmic protein CpxP/Spy
MNTMKKKLIALSGAVVLSLVAWAVAQGEDATAPARHQRAEGHRHGMFQRLGQDLNLSPDQKAKVQPIIDQARPQIRAIHEEAMQKRKTVMDNTMSQIRPLLTPEQQQKLDAMRKAREDMRNARREMRAARGR